MENEAKTPDMLMDLEAGFDDLTNLFDRLSIQDLRDNKSFSIEKELIKENISEDEAISYALRAILSSDKTQQFKGMCIIHRLLCKDIDPPIIKVINSGIVPHMIQLIPIHDALYAFYVLGILSNIASGDDSCTDYVINVKCIELLNTLLDTENDALFYQAMGVIANIAGGSSDYRNLILNQINFTTTITRLNTIEINRLKNNENPEKSSDLVGSIFNLVGKIPEALFYKVKDFAPFLESAITHGVGTDLIVNALQGYYYITESSNNSMVYSQELLLAIIHFFDSEDKQVLIHALGIFRNYSMTEVDSTFIIAYGVLIKLFHLAESSNSRIRYETFGIISNLFTEDSAIIESSIDAGYFDKIKHTIENDEDKDVRRLAIWAICFAAGVCTFSQAQKIISIGFVEILISCIANASKKTEQNILEGLEKYLKFDDVISCSQASEYLKKLRNIIICTDFDAFGRIIDRLEYLEEYSYEITIKFISGEGP